MSTISPTAPTCRTAQDYDRRHLAVYAALLDADKAGTDWRQVAADILGVDENAPGAEQCWSTHLARARWIIGEGLDSAILAFGK